MIVDGNLMIDLKGHKVYKERKEVQLSIKEYERLLVMIAHPGEALKKEWLFNQVWGVDSMSELSSLTVHIRWLREKLEEDAKNPKRVTTVWGIGYQWNRG